jgi:hypothetical protein
MKATALRVSRHEDRPDNQAGSPTSQQEPSSPRVQPQLLPSAGPKPGNGNNGSNGSSGHSLRMYTEEQVSEMLQVSLSQLREMQTTRNSGWRARLAYAYSCVTISPSVGITARSSRNTRNTSNWRRSYATKLRADTQAG